MMSGEKLYNFIMYYHETFHQQEEFDNVFAYRDNPPAQLECVYRSYIRDWELLYYTDIARLSHARVHACRVLNPVHIEQFRGVVGVIDEVYAEV